jgi:hypothetical protein
LELGLGSRAYFAVIGYVEVFPTDILNHIFLFLVSARDHERVSRRQMGGTTYKVKDGAWIQGRDAPVSGTVLVPTPAVAGPNRALEQLIAPDIPVVLNLLLHVERPGRGQISKTSSFRSCGLPYLISSLATLSTHLRM